MAGKATLSHRPDLSRFEVHLGDELAGYAEYSERGKVRDFNHTLTLPQFRGHGVAAQVVEYALNSSRADGFKVVPTCWYVEQFISSNPQYADLVG
ncbi:N-acetyltransferase [Skermania sp. ID1734]|uniref:GNAT family N-acetyltransferase n=1 Tax=Skermania sp. ID1734 TaxID=2597516 RepID=UPI00117E3CA9|nr:GNAT family N-acetyltransferase [Skermania sp. ID1734]TSD93945.1 N-acetyltransferase [Skermania sp. ID1734]